MDVIFLCHDMKEKDTDFNEEDIKKMIAYINNITNKKKIILYLVGCKLDQKFQIWEMTLLTYMKKMRHIN